MTDQTPKQPPSEKPSPVSWVCSSCKDYYESSDDHVCPNCGYQPCSERIEAAKSDRDWVAWRANPTEDWLKIREDEVLELLEKIPLDLDFRLTLFQLSPESHRAAENLLRRRRSEADKANQVLCNQCGEEMRRWFGSDANHWEVYGARVSFSTGYLSDPLGDGCNYAFNLCESCLDKMFKTFKIPVDETLY